MRSRVRAVWIAVGGVFTAVLVAVMAIAALAEIPVPGDWRSSRSYGSSIIGATTETTTVTYAITTPRIVVDVSAGIGVRVSTGEPGRLTVRRTLVWDGRGRRFDESWKDGGTLQATMTCGPSVPGASGGCQAEYFLTVPPDVEVLMATHSGPVTCRPSAAGEVTCVRPGTG
ncbi:hypothetical protein Pth03_71130 [Planotetraspora thailandica]|uniref:Uncharacterized protein n=1 Tax=Planotetraspora thailandica TaxID=487172 RepID=A0A8J4DDP5_9ACTN|nr:hypothetical protein [Planotetraspora thailandica]GII58724.1 hypothetical protein Pth03_71130 [Planotetraspora thailandica]